MIRYAQERLDYLKQPATEMKSSHVSSAFILTLLQIAFDESDSASPEQTCENTEVANCIVRGVADFLEKLETPSAKRKQFSLSYEEICRGDRASACRHQHKVQHCSWLENQTLVQLEDAVSSATALLCANNASLLNDIVGGLSCWVGHRFFECIKKKNIASQGADYFPKPLDLCGPQGDLASAFHQCLPKDKSRLHMCVEKPDTDGLFRLQGAFANIRRLCASGGSSAIASETLVAITTGLIPFVGIIALH